MEMENILDFSFSHRIIYFWFINFLYIAYTCMLFVFSFQYNNKCNAKSMNSILVNYWNIIKTKVCLVVKIRDEI